LQAEWVLLMRELEAVLSRVAQPTIAAAPTEARTGSRLASVGDSGLESEAPAESDTSPTVVIVEPRQSLLMDNIEQWGQSVHSATAPLLRSASGTSVCSKITDEEDPHHLGARPGASLSLASFYSAHTTVTDFTDCIDHDHDHEDMFGQHAEEIEATEASASQSFDHSVEIHASA
jgi:hypothetical protein